MVNIYSTTILSVGTTGDSYKDSVYVLRNYTYNMSLHIFRFIPFSIPFRFPFRVLVTPYQEEPIWCREWLSKWHLIYLWYRGLTFEVFTWMNESHGMTPQLIQRPCFFLRYLHSWVNLMEWHLKWCRGLTFEVLTCMF